MNRTGAFLLVAAVMASSAILAQALAREGFPHRDHQGLFPLCESCHGGIVTDSPGTAFPDPARCATCHDGERAAEVDWTAYVPDASNLDFSHRRHVLSSRAAGEETDCAGCHRAPGATESMAVIPATSDACMTCHADPAESHLSPGLDCRSCHVPLTDARALSPARIEAFPSPSTHEAAGFVANHAPGPRSLDCAICHARESCTRCHFNGETLAAVQSLGSDPRVAALERSRPPEYPEPLSHRVVEWSWLHAEEARTDDPGCANCHARSSCAACHTGYGGDAVAALPQLDPDDSRGVRVGEPAVVHDPGFELDHAPWAAADPGTCNSCHTPSFCESCHDGPDGAAFHFGNYLQMHGPEAWGNESECVTCHNPDVFCRGCHEGLGRGAEGRLDVAYHSRRPFWLFGHGTAARQGLESCRSCHSQADCTVCHAAVGSWRINPHGPGFQADRLREANPWSCLACHRAGVPR